MANVLETKTAGGQVLFPPVLTNEMFNLVRGKSSLARLSAARPISFAGNTMFTFNLDGEVAIVAESGQKPAGGGALAPINIVPLKIVYSMRESDEFRYSAEERQLAVLRAFAEGFANKVARGIDIMAFHGLNPATMIASNVIGTNHFDAAVTQTATMSADPNGDVNAAIALIEGNEYDVTGMAMAPAFRSALVNQKKSASSNESLFPELAWGSNPGTINGLPVDVNSTVSVNSNADRAILGNFRDFFRWGYAREVPLEIIEYGDPDGLGDLKRQNQICIRGEAYVGWGILIPEAFARIVDPTAGG